MGKAQKNYSATLPENLCDEVLSMLYPVDNNGLNKEVYGMGDEGNLILDIAKAAKNQPPMSNEK